MTPADLPTEKLAAPFSARQREQEGQRAVEMCPLVSGMGALRARIRAQSKSVAEHIAADPEARAFIDDWAAPDPHSR